MVELIRSDYPNLKRDKIDLNPLKRTALDTGFNSNIPMPRGTISPVKLTKALDDILPPNAIVTAEPGDSAIYPSALLSVRENDLA